jgi:(1->4)-alpha-D-glucan 1-alpha-D-glucosylmutase
LFLQGEYIPVTGNEKIVAYARKHNNKWVLIVFPVHIKTITENKGGLLGEQAWSNDSLHLPEGAPTMWKNIFTNETVTGDKQLLLKEVFAKFPLALLTAE